LRWATPRCRPIFPALSSLAALLITRIKRATGIAVVRASAAAKVHGLKIRDSVKIGTIRRFST
jgi:hypothetical protein